MPFCFKEKMTASKHKFIHTKAEDFSCRQEKQNKTKPTSISALHYYGYLLASTAETEASKHWNYLGN